MLLVNELAKSIAVNLVDTPVAGKQSEFFLCYPIGYLNLEDRFVVFRNSVFDIFNSLFSDEKAGRCSWRKGEWFSWRKGWEVLLAKKWKVFLAKNLEG